MDFNVGSQWFGFKNVDFKDLAKEIQGLDSKNKGYEQLGTAQSGFSWMDQIGFQWIESGWFSSDWISLVLNGLDQLGFQWIGSECFSWTTG